MHHQAHQYDKRKRERENGWLQIATRSAVTSPSSATLMTPLLTGSGDASTA